MSCPDLKLLNVSQKLLVWHLLIILVMIMIRFHKFHRKDPTGTSFGGSHSYNTE